MNLKNNFLLKKDIIILCLRTNNLHDMIYGSWDKECDRLKFVIMGHFLPFTLPLKNEKNQNFEKMKKIAGDMEWDTEFFVILGHFLPLYPLTTGKNNEKSILRCYHFTHVYQNSQSYDVCSMRYGIRHIIFCHFGPFFALYPTIDSKNKNLE